MDSLMDDINQIAIVGTGLLGVSMGLGLKATGYAGRIVGVGRRQVTLDKALQTGGVDEVSLDLQSVVRESRLVVVGVPLGAFAGVFQSIAACDHDELVITDVGSTKLQVLDEARKFLPNPQRFVGSHPMAGSEKQGPEAARADLFGGKPCIITRETDTEPRALAVIESLWRRLEMSLLYMSAMEHDSKAAAISHVPHLATVLIIETVARLGGWDIASTGFKDTTRLASSNPPMRADIIAANREQILRTLEVFRELFDEMHTVIAQNDYTKLLTRLENDKQLRDEWLRGYEQAATRHADEE